MASNTASAYVVILTPLCIRRADTIIVCIFGSSPSQLVNGYSQKKMFSSHNKDFEVML